MTDDLDPAPVDEPAAPPPGDRPRTKAERLEAKAAKLRAEEERKAQQAQAAAASGVTFAAPSRTGLVVAVSVLGVLVVVLAVAVGIGLPWALHQRDLYHHQHDLLSKQLAKNAQLAKRGQAVVLPATQAGALAAAKQYAVDFGSYDYQHLDADLAKVAAELTPSFRSSYEKSAAGLKPTILKYHGKSVAQVQGAGVASATADSVTVLVFLDQTVTSSQVSQSRIDRNRVVMTLVRSGSKWLISNLVLK